MKKKEETVFSEIFRNSKRKNLNSTNSWSPCKKRETRFVPFSSRILIANSFRKPKRPLIFHSERNNLANDNESVRDRKANDRKPGGHPSLSKGRANAAVRKRYDSTTISFHFAKNDRFRGYSSRNGRISRARISNLT